MKLAFWKGKRARRGSPGPANAGASSGAGAGAGTSGGAEPVYASAGDDPEADEVAAARLRVRTRRRLVGAFALLLAVVVFVPMLLDPTPRAVPDNIPIDLPSDKTPFVPRVAAPAADVPASTSAALEKEGAAMVPAAPGSAADTAAEAAPTPAASSAHAAAPPAASTAVPASARSAAAAGRIFVQAAAMSHESKAQDLANRIAKAGLAPFVERTDTSDGARYRVRLGPFATRGEADRIRARLRAMGVSANIVGA